MKQYSSDRACPFTPDGSSVGISGVILLTAVMVDRARARKSG
jgi:hypothetical protein